MVFVVWFFLKPRILYLVRASFPHEDRHTKFWNDDFGPFCSSEFQSEYTFLEKTHNRRQGILMIVTAPSSDLRLSPILKHQPRKPLGQMKKGSHGGFPDGHILEKRILGNLGDHRKVVGRMEHEDSI